MSSIKRLAVARAAYDRVLVEEARTAHREIVVPFCERWGVSFVAGMGTWAFCHDVKPIRLGDDNLPAALLTSSRFPREFGEVCGQLWALCEALDDETYVADYFDDYTPHSKE